MIVPQMSGWPRSEASIEGNCEISKTLLKSIIQQDRKDFAVKRKQKPIVIFNNKCKLTGLRTNFLTL